MKKLTKKQTDCIVRYLNNGFNKCEAYKYAFDCSNMQPSSIALEACKFFKNPKVRIFNPSTD